MKSRSTTVILAVFFGIFGVHHFYVGDKEKGLIYLLVSLLVPVIGVLVINILSIIDIVSILCMSDDAFELKVKKNSLNSSEEESVVVGEDSIKMKQGQLRQAKELFDTNILTEQEFNTLKKKILGE